MARGIEERMFWGLHKQQFECAYNRERNSVSIVVIRWVGDKAECFALVFVHTCARPQY
jgi:hypothetical protein